MVGRRKSEHSLTRPEFIVGFVLGGLFVAAMFVDFPLTIQALGSFLLICAGLGALRILFARERKRLAGRSQPAYSGASRILALLVLCGVLAAGGRLGLDYLRTTLEDEIVASIEPPLRGEEILVLAVPGSDAPDVVATAQALVQAYPAEGRPRIREELVPTSWRWLVTGLETKELAARTGASLVFEARGEGAIQVTFFGVPGAFRRHEIQEVLGRQGGWQFSANPRALQTNGELAGALTCFFLGQEDEALSMAEEALARYESAGMQAPLRARLHAVAGLVLARRGQCREAAEHRDAAALESETPGALREAVAACREPEPRPVEEAVVDSASGTVVEATATVAALPEIESTTAAIGGGTPTP